MQVKSAVKNAKGRTLMIFIFSRKILTEAIAMSKQMREVKNKFILKFIILKVLISERGPILYRLKMKS